MEKEKATIETARRLYEAGDYRQARRIAKQIADDQDETPERQDEAKAILKGTGIDPAAVVAIALTTGVFLFLVIFYLL